MAGRSLVVRMLAGLALVGGTLVPQADSATAAPTTPAAPTVVGVAAATYKATAISAGYLATCALTTKGGVLCWGSNFTGQLGDGSFKDSSTPVAVAGLSKGVKAISTGYEHSCALTKKGKVWCWGSNSDGQVGSSAPAVAWTPVAVTGLGKGVKAISAGGFHTCALTRKGKARCWGSNNTGQLGNGLKVDSASPVAVKGLGKGVKAISAGYSHTCAITSKGAAKCWGDNEYGQLGDSTFGNSLSPVTVFGLTRGVRRISAANSSTCAVTARRAVTCWGDNEKGQLGNANPADSNKPVTAVGLGKRMASVAASDTHGCAVTTSGRVLCWGENTVGELGNNNNVSSSIPVAVYDLPRSTKVTVGAGHTCVVTARGVAQCWGRNDSGQLGVGTTTNTYARGRVVGF